MTGDAEMAEPDQEIRAAVRHEQGLAVKAVIALAIVALWLTATTLVIKPNAESPHRSAARAGSRLRSLAGRAASRPKDRAAAT